MITVAQGIQITRNKIYFVLCFLFFAVTSAFSQGYSEKQYTSMNGLSQNSVKSMMLDKDGFLWIGTEAGIVRFDGRVFKIFNKNNSPIIKNDRILKFYQTANKGIYGYDGSGSFYPLEINRLSDKKQSSEDIFQSRQRNLVGNLPSRSIYNWFFIKKAESELFNKGWIIAPYQTMIMDDSTFMVNGKRSLLIYRDTLLIDSIPTGEIQCNTLLESKKQFYIVTNRNELFYVNLQQHKIQPCVLSNFSDVPFNKINYIQDTQNDRVYLKVDDKLYAFNARSNPLEIGFELIVEGLPNKCKVTGVLFHETQKLYFLGTDSKGLFVFKPNYFKTVIVNDTVNQPETGSTNAFYTQLVVDSSHVMVSDNRFIGIEGKVSPKFMLGRYNLESFITDKKGKIWAADRNTLISFDPVTQIRKEYKTTPGATINFIFDGDSVIYAGTRKNLMYVKGDSLVTCMEYFDKKEHLMIFSMVEMKDGYNWFGTCEGVFCFKRGNGIAVPQLKLSNVCARTVYNIENYLLIGTYGDGYYIWDGKEIRKMPVDRSNFMTHVHSFFLDKFGYLWMASNHGLFKTHIDNIKHYLKDPSFEILYQFYGDENGIKNIEFNGGCYPPYALLPNGYLSYPTMEGLVWFNPESVNPDRMSDKVVIERIQTDNGNIYPADTKKISINAYNKTLSIVFSTPFWGNPQNLVMDYMLTGFNNTWSPIRMYDSRITYSSLGSGEYVFRIRKRIGFGPNDYLYTEVPFVIEKKFYETKWFLVLILLFIAGLFWLLLKINVRRIRKQNDFLESKISERTGELADANLLLDKQNKLLPDSQIKLRNSVKVKDKLISIITHDIITPLKFISLASKGKIQNQPEPKGDHAIELLNDISNTSERLYDNAQNILNWMKYQGESITVDWKFVSVYAVVEDIFGLLHSQAVSKNTQLLNNINEDDIIKSDENILYIILMNILSNSLKFTDGGEIRVSSSYLKGEYHIIIEDNGKGMNAQKLAKINQPDRSFHSGKETYPGIEEGFGLGYIIISELLNLVSGRYIVESTPGKGTKVEIFLPVGK